MQSVRDQGRMSISDAFRLWIDRAERENLATGSIAQYNTMSRKLRDWADKHGVQWIQDITPLQLENWYSSPDWTRYKEATRSQRWGVMRSLFAYLKLRRVIEVNPISSITKIPCSGELVQGPYSDEQIKRVFAEVANGDLPVMITAEEKQFYRERLAAYILLLLYTGCDLVDAALFEPARIKDLIVEDETVPVYRYSRTKTGVDAVIPLPVEVATALRNVPVLSTNPPGMPFRTAGVRLIADPKFWSRRIRRCLRLAGVQTVSLPGLDSMGRPRSHKANAKQFRHTFAVRQLIAGQRPEEVAKMMGHTDTRMIREHYAPWVEELDTAHVRMVMERRTASKPKHSLRVVSAPSTSDAPAEQHSLVSAS